MTTHLKIDIDSETIEIHGLEYTRDQLVDKIKLMLSNGEHAIGHLAHGLETLSQTLEQLKTVNVRMTSDMVHALTRVAEKQGRTMGSFVRESLAASLAIIPSHPAGEAKLEILHAADDDVEEVTSTSSSRSAGGSRASSSIEGQEGLLVKRWFGN